MGIVSAKVVGLVMAGALTASAATYGAGEVVTLIKSKITQLEDKAELYHDEAYTLGRNANQVIAGKNAEITRLESEIDRLNAEVEEANVEIAEGNTEINKANGELAKAETDINSINAAADASLAKVNNLPSIGGLADGKAQVNGLELTVAVVASQSSRTVKLGNPNTVDVVVSYSGGQVTVPAGDVIYIKNSPSAEPFTYTIPGTEVTKSNTK